MPRMGPAPIPGLLRHGAQLLEVANDLRRIYCTYSNAATSRRRVARGPTFLIGPGAVRAEYNSLRARETEILAELPTMTTETMFLIVTRYQLRNIYVNGTLLVSTYLCLQKLTPIKGFP